MSTSRKPVTDTVRSYVEAKIVDRVGGWFDRAEFPAREIAPELGQIGLLGMHFEGYGCAGTNAVSYGLVSRARGR